MRERRPREKEEGRKETTPIPPLTHRLRVAPNRVGLPSRVDARRIGLVQARGAFARRPRVGRQKTSDQRRNAKRPHASALRVALLNACDVAREVVDGRRLV